TKAPRHEGKASVGCPIYRDSDGWARDDRSCEIPISHEHSWESLPTSTLAGVLPITGRDSCPDGCEKGFSRQLSLELNLSKHTMVGMSSQPVMDAGPE